MKKQKRKFILAEATVDDINKQLKINMFAMVVLVFMLFLNIVQFMNSYSLLIGGLIIVGVILLFIMAKSRTLLKMRKQALIK